MLRGSRPSISMWIGRFGGKSAMGFFNPKPSPKPWIFPHHFHQERPSPLMITAPTLQSCITPWLGLSHMTFRQLMNEDSQTLGSRDDSEYLPEICLSPALLADNNSHAKYKKKIVRGYHITYDSESTLPPSDKILHTYHRTASGSLATFVHRVSSWVLALTPCLYMLW